MLDALDQRSQVLAGHRADLRGRVGQDRRLPGRRELSIGNELVEASLQLIGQRGLDVRRRLPVVGGNLREGLSLPELGP